MVKKPHKRKEEKMTGPSTQLQSQITEEDFTAFIGRNAHKYIPKFSKFNIGGVDNFSMTWHWPAFICNFWWLLYRKLYLWALISFFVLIIPYIGLLVAIALGMAGNYIYYLDSQYKPQTKKQTTSGLDALRQHTKTLSRCVLYLFTDPYQAFPLFYC